MGMIAIARLLGENNKLVGMRLLSFTDNGIKKKMDTETRDVPMDSIKNVILSGKAEISNLGIVDGKVVGTNGSIERYAGLISYGKTFILPEGSPSPLVILNKLGDVGYTVSDFNGVAKRLTTDVVVDYASSKGIANGKVSTTKEGNPYIASISGEYDEVKTTKSKYGGKTVDMSHLGLSTKKDTSLIAKETGTAVENSIEYKDAFNTIDPKQESVMKDWYMWYTVKAYEEVSHSLRLDIAPAKIANLARFKSDLEWRFAGISDAKIYGASHCELGHPIRYEYHAKAYDEFGDEAGELIFGETCSSDFFEISKEDMAKLVKVRMQMTHEIELITDAFTNGTVNVEWEKCGAFKKIIERMVADRRGREDYVDLFGHEPAVFLSKYMTAGIPFPESLILQAKKNMMNCDRTRILSCIFGNKEKWASYAGVLDSDYGIEAKIGYGRREKVSIMARFIDWVVGMSVAGVYGYYPPLYEVSNGRNLSMKIGKNDEDGKKLASRLNMGTGQFSKEDKDWYWYGVRRFVTAFSLQNDLFSSRSIIGAGDQSELLVKHFEYVARLADAWMAFSGIRNSLVGKVEEYRNAQSELDKYCSENSIYLRTEDIALDEVVGEHMRTYRYNNDNPLTLVKSIGAFVLSAADGENLETSEIRKYMIDGGRNKNSNIYYEYIEALKQLTGESDGGEAVTKEIFEVIAGVTTIIKSKTEALQKKLEEQKLSKIKKEEERKEAERLLEEARKKKLEEDAKAKEDEERKKKELEDAKAKANEAGQVNKLGELKTLLVKWKDKDNSYKTAIAYDIAVERSIEDYESLSYKQKRIIDEAYEMFKYIDSNNGELPSDDAKELDEEDISRYQAVIQKIADNSKLRKEIEAVDKIGIDVLKTVVRTKKSTPKQQKHVDTVIKMAE